jgi:hypothetical protein
MNEYNLDMRWDLHRLVIIDIDKITDIRRDMDKDMYSSHNKSYGL